MQRSGGISATLTADGQATDCGTAPLGDAGRRHVAFCSHEVPMASFFSDDGLTRTLASDSSQSVAFALLPGEGLGQIKAELGSVVLVRPPGWYAPSRCSTRIHVFSSSPCLPWRR